MKVSNCCEAPGDYKMGKYIPCTFENFNACPKCGEHCEYIEETDLNELDIRSKSEKWWDMLPIYKQSLLFSKYPLTQGNSLVEHIKLMYLYETDLNTINTENEQDKDNKLREVL